jgi:hypothetical protein
MADRPFSGTRRAGLFCCAGAAQQLIAKKQKRRNEMKGMAMAVIGLIMTAGAASAATLNVEPSTLKTVDEALVKMQQEMIQKNYSAMLLKDQMRGKMMAERTPQNFMQDAIQPVMMQKMRDQIKPQQMQIMQAK